MDDTQQLIEIGEWRDLSPFTVEVEHLSLKSQTSEYHNTEGLKIHDKVSENILLDDEPTKSQIEFKYSLSYKSKEGVNFSRRYDVLNKSILRGIKRVFMKKFRTQNKKIAGARYAQTRAAIILKSFKAMLTDMLEYPENIDQISQFVMIFCGIQPKTRYPFEKDIKNKGAFAVD